MIFEDLVGRHELTGVDFINQNIGDPASAVNFTLDGITYTAIEDEQDGYRSSLGEFKVSDQPVLNVFAPCAVNAILRPETDGREQYILDLVDTVTGGVVFSVGTDYSDDYYPTYVASFDPTKMAINLPPYRPFEQLAEEAYSAYGEHQGNKNYQGLPMPEWKDLRPDIQGAWVAAVDAAVRGFEYDRQRIDDAILKIKGNSNG